MGETVRKAMSMDYMVAVVTYEDGPGYVVRAEARHGERVVWRIAGGLCEGSEFATAPASGDAVASLRAVLGVGWRVQLVALGAAGPLLRTTERSERSGCERNREAIQRVIK